jgi:chromosomal replication initiator protein
VGRRKNGQGLIRQRKDGRWEGRCVVGYDEKNLPITKNVLAKTKREVEEKLKALKHLAGSPPSISMAQSVIKDILSDDQPAPITVEKIIVEVADVYGVSPEDIRSSKRSSQISTARKVAIYVVREITQMPLQAIGTEFGGRDHSTIVYSISNIETAMKHDDHLKQLVEDIIKNIRSKSHS